MDYQIHELYHFSCKYFALLRKHGDPFTFPNIPFLHALCEISEKADVMDHPLYHIARKLELKKKGQIPYSKSISNMTRCGIAAGILEPINNTNIGKCTLDTSSAESVLQRYKINQTDLQNIMDFEIHILAFDTLDHAKKYR